MKYHFATYERDIGHFGSYSLYIQKKTTNIGSFYTYTQPPEENEPPGFRTVKKSILLSSWRFDRNATCKRPLFICEPSSPEFAIFGRFPNERFFNDLITGGYYYLLHNRNGRRVMRMFFGTTMRPSPSPSCTPTDSSHPKISLFSFHCTSIDNYLIYP